MRKMSIIIPTYNRAESLRHTLDSLMALEVPEGVVVEIIVIDNNSPDHTSEVAHEAAARSPIPIRVVVEKRQGLCYGRNRGLEEASGEHLVFLDDDIEVNPIWIRSYLEAADAFGADCVVGPVYPAFPDPVPSYATLYVLSQIGSDYSRKGDEAMILVPELRHQIPGCNFAVRKQTANEIGGFDNTLDRVGSGLIAGGDTEFGLRLAANHRVVAYHPGCSVNHLIEPWKLTKSYLRRRANGLGATAARLRRTHPLDACRKRTMKLAVGCFRRWVWKVLRGAPDAFEWELRWRRAIHDGLRK